MIEAKKHALLPPWKVSTLATASVNADEAFRAECLEKIKELFAPAIPTNVFFTYWAFAVERQNIFFRRFHRKSQPWTQDEILLAHRFTNVYRATDRVSQYLISKVQYNAEWGATDILFRTLLFKIFNRIDTWELLTSECGEPRWPEYSYERYAKVLDIAMAKGKRIYSAAYIMPSGGKGHTFKRKHHMHLSLLERMVRDGVADKLAAATTMREAFGILRAYPSIGDFLAYQYVTDINYSSLTRFEETEFVVAGPGALEGIDKCFVSKGGKDHAWIIRRSMEVQDECFVAINRPFQSLWGRKLQLIDCQNLFCEVAKYARVKHPEVSSASGRTRIKQKFSPKEEPIAYAFPEKWGISIPSSRLIEYVAPI